jgi:hypothetical protein
MDESGQAQTGITPDSHEDGAVPTAADESAHVEESGAEDGTVPRHRRGYAWLARRWEFTRQGFTPAVWVLLVLTLATGVYGWRYRPNITVPQPPISSVLIAFTPGHAAHSPISVDVRLVQDDPPPDGGSPRVTLAITLSGHAFTHDGWYVAAYVPVGVRVNTKGTKPRLEKVDTISPGTAAVTLNPGPQQGGTFTELLEWDNLTSGPMQVSGANLMAVFPDLAVRNQTNTGIFPPGPAVTVRRELVPGGGFTYLNGPPPEKVEGPTWLWAPVTGYVDDPGTPLLNAEARSAPLDEKAQAAQFYSGVAFGVAASAFIAGVVEFVNAGRRRRDPGSRPAEGAGRQRRR